MDDFDYYKELYQVENDRHDAVNESLNLPVAIASGLLTFLFYLVTTFDYAQGGCHRWLFVVMAGFGLLMAMVSLFYLIRAFNNITAGFEYKGLPYPKALFEHRRKLHEYYSQYGQGESQANEKFIEYLTDKFAEHADYNMHINDSKLRNIFHAKRYMVFSLFGLALACFPFAYNFFHKTDPISHVEVVKDPETLTGLPQQQSHAPTPQDDERQGERPDTTTTTTTTTGQAHQGESRADSNQHRAR